jgi:cytochrome c oxidase assembly protein subunit 15
MQKSIGIWLLTCCALVFAMVVVGGVTRLTHSGLSIVEWQPIVGTIPPLSQSDWEVLFEKYHQTPQYKKINLGMSLEEFKGIFWWEYFHRLLGRVIGLAFFIPFVYFLARKGIDRPLGLKLTGIFVLGGLQGAMGWYMVKSGLVDNPHVSQYRLTAHLGLAFIIYAAMFRVALGLLLPADISHGNIRLRGLHRFSLGLTTLIFVMEKR